MIEYALSFAAGVAAIASPCVLPILPILISSAINSGGIKHAIGLPIGLALSFSIVGICLASLGSFLGLSNNSINNISAIILIALGVSLLLKKFIYLKKASNIHMFNLFNSLANSIQAKNFISQFCIGALLGVAWTPCIGPILGGAITLAAQGKNLLYASLIMLSFSLGVCLPIALLIAASKNSLLKHNHKHKYKSKIKIKIILQNISKYSNVVLANLLIIWGIFLLFSIDKKISIWLA
jgi:cytochrome c-type biogenesis protein